MPCSIASCSCDLADSVLAPDCEQQLVAIASGGAAAAPCSPGRREDLVPARDGLPALERYARLAIAGERRVAGHAETTRGCKHMCRHCPIPPVYGGRFFAVPADVVLDDVRRQVAAGARHIDFGDPDFLNGPNHALRVARALHAEHPELTFSFTAKVEHIVAHADVVRELGGLGALFVVSAVESLSDRVLAALAKGHHAADVARALAVVRGARMSLRPTFVAFTPWTTLADYLELCRFIRDNRLQDEVDPVQLSIRLLVPPGSLLLAAPDIAPYLGPLDPAGAHLPLDPPRSAHGSAGGRRLGAGRSRRRSRRHRRGHVRAHPPAGRAGRRHRPAGREAAPTAFGPAAPPDRAVVLLRAADASSAARRLINAEPSKGSEPPAMGSDGQSPSTPYALPRQTARYGTTQMKTMLTFWTVPAMTASHAGP